MKYWVLGLGVSGQAAMEWLANENVQGVDDKLNPFDGEPEKEDTVVVSPGIPPTHPFYEAAVRNGCTIIGEAELALREHEGGAIGVTGTNGKTTVTLMTTKLLQLAGVDAKAVGNVGTPLCSIARESGFLVVELSSFQLERMYTRCFDRGVILNITPDHLDRYPNFEAYAAAKRRLLNLCKEECLESGTIDLTKTQWLQRKFPDWPLHDIENALTAFQLASFYGAGEPELLQMMQTFKKPEHRLEFIGQLMGVSYYNDSKATNVAATLSALRSLSCPIHLIAGGVHKGSSYVEWAHWVKERVRGVYLIGEAAKEIEADLGNAAPCYQCGTLERAIEEVRSQAKPGEAVLFSPGCSSFDQFKNYELRGKRFKEKIIHLMERIGHESA